MNNTLVILGLLFVVVLVCIPALMALKMFLGVVASYREHRIHLQRRVICTIPRVGQFESYGDGIWFGDVGDLEITVEARGEPDESTTTRLRSLLSTVPALTEQANDYLVANDATAAHICNGNPRSFRTVGIVCYSDHSVDFELTHERDEDGFYRVHFVDGIPVSYARDD